MWRNSKNIINKVLILLPFGLFILGLVSQSASKSTFLGKNLSLWVSTITFGIIVIIMVIITRRFPICIKVKEKIVSVLLISVISVLLFEFAAFLFARYLPLEILFRTPVWIQDILPKAVFEREHYRVAYKDEYIDDPVFAWRYAPQLNVVFKNPEFSYRLITDSYGFRNVDESLYNDADVIVT